MTTRILCRDGPINLQEIEVKKLQTFLFFKEVAQLEIGDTLDLNVTKSFFNFLFDLLCHGKFPRLSIDTVLDKLNNSKLFQSKELIKYCQDFIRCEFMTSCIKGDLQKVMLLHSFDPTIFIIPMTFHFAFQESSKHGHLDIVQWLCRLNMTPDVDVLYWGMEEHLDIMQLLCSISSVNIHEKDEYLFRMSCNKGHLDIAQWLHSKYPVDHHAKYDGAFRAACRNGYLEVAQWLYCVSPEIPNGIWLSSPIGRTPTDDISIIKYAWVSKYPTYGIISSLSVI